MTDSRSSEGLHGYAEQVLAGTGLTLADVTAGGDPAEGSAAQALQEGWDIAARAAKVLGHKR